MNVHLESALATRDMANLLSLIEVAHAAATKAEFRQSVIRGVGALIESSFCSWTELDTDLFDNPVASTRVAETSTERFDVHDTLDIFNAVAHQQHPVIRLAIEKSLSEAVSISDLVERAAFNRLALYTHFYRQFGVEDQLSLAVFGSRTVTAETSGTYRVVIDSSDRDEFIGSMSFRLE